MQGVRERRCSCAGLTGEATEPGHALAGGVADGRPERPSIVVRLDRELRSVQRFDGIAEAPVVLGPDAEGRPNRQGVTGRYVRGASSTGSPAPSITPLSERTRSGPDDRSASWWNRESF